MNKEALTELSKYRALMYRFLGGLYIMEVDEDQLRSMKKLEFPEITGTEEADLDLKEGYLLVKEYVAGAAARDLEDLAADYAKVFLAAGDATGRAAFPYESVYIDNKRQVGGSSEMQMKALYLERGWEPDPNVYRTMYDNIGLMLEYMGIICDEITDATQQEDRDKFAMLISESLSAPLILCTEEDVEGEHGASIGQPDIDVIFYLKSRGIAIEKIYEMLSVAKVEAALSRIGHEETTDLVRDFLGVNKAE